MSKRLLALDLGNHTGVAYKSLLNEYVCETWIFTPRRAHSPGMRWLYFAKRLNEFHQLMPVGMVIFEDVQFATTTHAGHVYGGFLAHLQAWADLRKIEYHGVSVPTLKKWATTKGNASKPLMMAAARRFGWEPEDDNQADAALLYEYARQEILK